MHRARQRAERLAHVHKTNRQDQRLAIGNKRADNATREGGAERWADPAVHTRLAVDRARISSDAERLCEVERTILKPATHHDANTRYLLQTGPSLGTILSRVWRDDIHDLNRFPMVQDVVSYGRLVTCAKASAGNRLGTSGTTIGQAHLPWALSDAAVLGRRDHPPAQPDLARLEHNHDQGNALTGLAHPLARAVYDRHKRHVACDQDQCCHHAWRGADEPGASRDTQGLNRPDALDTAASRASLTAQARRGRETLSPARCLALRSRSSRLRREASPVDGGGPAPAPGAHWSTIRVEPAR
jgi:hypothetical protein